MGDVSDHLLAELECLRGTFAVTETDRFLGLAPFFHVNGLVRTMLTSMYGGATLYPIAEFRPSGASRTTASCRSSSTC